MISEKFLKIYHPKLVYITFALIAFHINPNPNLLLAALVWLGSVSDITRRHVTIYSLIVQHGYLRTGLINIVVIETICRHPTSRCKGLLDIDMFMFPNRAIGVIAYY